MSGDRPDAQVLDPVTPGDYDASDGFNEENGLEHCPHCGKQFGGQSGHLGEVFDSEGNRYEHFYNSPPGQSPFFCPECWEELEANQKQSENRALGDFDE